MTSVLVIGDSLNQGCPNFFFFFLAGSKFYNVKGPGCQLLCCVTGFCFDYIIREAGVGASLMPRLWARLSYVQPTALLPPGAQVLSLRVEIKSCKVCSWWAGHWTGLVPSHQWS